MLYTLSIASSVVWLVSGILLMTASEKRQRVLDVLLAGIVGGLIGGRVGHVALLWAYFSQMPTEILQWRVGGLNWHGVVIGALLAIRVMAALRGIAWHPLSNRLAIGLPLIGLHAWAGCIVALCSYGAEVPTLAYQSPWLVWETADVYGIVAPRYATQTLGMLGMGGLIVVAFLWRGRGRLWGVLALMSAFMLALDGLRGDVVPLLAGIRADQWLDMTLLSGAAILWWRQQF